jgi:hypothetical protein
VHGCADLRGASEMRRSFGREAQLQHVFIAANAGVEKTSSEIMRRHGGAIGSTSVYDIHVCTAAPLVAGCMESYEGGLWSADRHPNATATTICLALSLAFSHLHHQPAAAVRTNTISQSLLLRPSRCQRRFPSALSHLLARAGFRWLLVDAWEAHW